MKNRRKIQNKILNMTSADIASDQASESSEDTSMSIRDREFLSKVQSVIDTNIEEESFNVASLADELSMSYNNLYLKIKSLTGQTPQTYLNTYKMNIAKKLLEEGSLTVSEVSYKVGASSISSFSRSFKKQFGIPPSEVRPN
ncbi:MAG: helix-turn-helix transcriptional regulator [Bacteroidales bacterium]|nr:helix-turn-helix transcriptional regulator [Bacteroidales bacterium]